MDVIWKPPYLEQFDLAVPLRPPVLLAEAQDHHRLAHLLLGGGSPTRPTALVAAAAAVAATAAATDVLVEHRQEVLRVGREPCEVVTAATR